MCMQTSEMISWEYHKALQKFVENMDYVVSRSEYKTIDSVQLVCIKLPILNQRYF